MLIALDFVRLQLQITLVQVIFLLWNYYFSSPWCGLITNYREIFIQITVLLPKKLSNAVICYTPPFHSVCRLFATLHTQKMQRWNSSLRIILVWTKVCLFSVQAKCRLVDITYKITRLISFDYIIPNLHVRTTYRLRKVISSRGLCNAHY